MVGTRVATQQCDANLKKENNDGLGAALTSMRRGHMCLLFMAVC